MPNMQLVSFSTPPPLISLNRVYNKRKSLLILSALPLPPVQAQPALPRPHSCAQVLLDKGEFKQQSWNHQKHKNYFCPSLKNCNFNARELLRSLRGVAICTALEVSCLVLLKKNFWRKIYLRDAIICWIMLEEKKSKHLNGKFGVSLSDATFSKSHLEPHKWEGGMCSLYQ